MLARCRGLHSPSASCTRPSSPTTTTWERLRCTSIRHGHVPHLRRHLDAYGPIAELPVAVCCVVSKVAAVAVPLPFRLTFTGSDKAKSWQLRLP